MCTPSTRYVNVYCYTFTAHLNAQMYTFRVYALKSVSYDQVIGYIWKTYSRVTRLHFRKRICVNYCFVTPVFKKFSPVEVSSLSKKVLSGRIKLNIE